MPAASLIESWLLLVAVARVSGHDIDDREHAQLFVAGAMTGMGMLSASAKSKDADRFIDVFNGLCAECDAFMEGEPTCTTH